MQVFTITNLSHEFVWYDEVSNMLLLIFSVVTFSYPDRRVSEVVQFFFVPKETEMKVRQLPNFLVECLKTFTAILENKLLALFRKNSGVISDIQREVL